MDVQLVQHHLVKLLSFPIDERCHFRYGFVLASVLFLFPKYLHPFKVPSSGYQCIAVPVTRGALALHVMSLGSQQSRAPCSAGVRVFGYSWPFALPCAPHLHFSGHTDAAYSQCGCDED